MVYGSEVVLPVDVLFKSPKIGEFDEESTGQFKQTEVNLLEERRIAAEMQQAHHEQQIRRYHNRNGKERSLNVGNLALQRIQNPRNSYKLSSPWKGPFVIKEVIQPATYHL